MITSGGQAGTAASPPIRPSRAWYWVAGCALAGALICLALAVAGFFSLNGQIKAFQRVRVPGQAEVVFAQPGRYVLYVERPGQCCSIAIGSGSAPFSSWSMNVAMRAVNDGPPVSISTWRGATQSYGVAGHQGQAAMQVTIGQPGRYLLRATDVVPRSITDLAVGRGIGRGLLIPLVLALVALFALIPAGLLAGGVTFLRRRRARRNLPAALQALPVMQPNGNLRSAMSIPGPTPPDPGQPGQHPAGGHPGLPGQAEDLLGRRVGAAFIDIALLAGLLVIMGLTVGQASVGGGGFDISLGPAWFLVYLALVLLYYFTTETATGQTVGKRLLGLRVVRTDGSRPSAAAVAGRTLLRLIDWLPALYLTGFITVLATGPRRQRLGDLAARTGVARALPARRPGLAYIPLALVLVAVAGLSAYRASSPGGGPPAHSAPGPAATSATGRALTGTEQAFVTHMRTRFNFSGKVADNDIATFGAGVCTGRRAGQSQAAVTSGAKSQWTNTSASDAYAITRLAEADMCPAYLPKQTRHTIARFTGTGATSTARFTVGGNGTWVLHYSYDCSAQPFGFGNFFVDEDAMNTDNLSAVAVNRLGRRGHGSWHVHGDAGRHYLAIHTKCSYAMSVVQKY